MTNKQPLDSLCSVVADCPHSTPKWMDSGVCVLGANNVKHGRIDYAKMRFTNEENYLKRIKRAVPQARDIVITREAPMGEVCLVPNDFKCCLGQRVVLLRVDPEKASAEFVFYALQSPAVQHQISWNEGTGSTVSNLRIPHLKDLQIPSPPIKTQEAIAHILGTLDDKIELNRRMNETLEAMAQALFKSWFVDFDPVKAKMEGKQPEGMDAETAALFPDKLVESDLGMIPEGWEVGSLKNVATNIRETVKPKDLHDTEPYIGLEHMPKKSIALSQWEYADKVTSNKSRFKNGDFLFGKLRPYFHKVGIAVIDGICSTDILVIRPMDENYYSFVISYISSEEFIDYTDRLSNGAKMPRTNWKDMGKYPTPLPPTSVARAFSNAMKPLYAKIAQNIYQAKELSAARNALLPKLIAGELSISEIETLSGASSD